MILFLEISVNDMGLRTTIPLVYYLMILTLIHASEISSNFKNSTANYTWLTIEEWGPCSTSCGNGTREKILKCFQNSTNTEIAVSNNLCKHLMKPKPLKENCNIGKCENRYHWRESKWSECSQTCGNAGRRSRDLECLYYEGSQMIVSNDKYCESVTRPESTSPCNVKDCPPIFVTGNWQKCEKSQKCLPGKQQRSLDCVSLLKTGKRKQVSKTACYKKYLPPPSWRKCYDHVNTKECLKSNEQMPQIETKNITSVQMRKTKKMTIQIGQTVHALLFTRIIIKCPVNFFIKRDLNWKHKSILYKFDGNLQNRIKVDRKGRLRITKFKPEDQGVWTCIAGSVNASSFIKTRNPSVGYQDWILRTALWNKEMLNEDPHSGIVKQDVIQWIITAWSACSVSCQGEGVQTRTVHCEEIDTRHYNILNNNVCEKRGQKKPGVFRICLRSSRCPKWSYRDLDINECTDQCIAIGVAKIKGKLSCMYQDNEIDHSSCNKSTIPQMECPNINCQVAWRKSKWSKCSLSCGGVGIMARYLICVWKNTGQQAGSVCHRTNLPVPRVIKACIAPKCNLGCVDLSSNCHRLEKFCKHTLYMYACCNTCMKAHFKFKKRKLFEGISLSNNVPDVTTYKMRVNPEFNMTREQERNTTFTMH